MKKRLFVTVMLLFALVFASVPVFADTGPKPYVAVTFTGLADTDCYVTLLSEERSTGPYSAYDGSNAAIPNLGGDSDNTAVWQKFQSYQDADGFYFLQYFGQLNAQQTFSWTYYPPQTFKILVYFPKTDSFAVSDNSCKQYAFHSLFTAHLSSVSGTASFHVSESGADEFPVEESYDYRSEIVSFFVRFLITVALELLVAWLFGFTAKRQIRVILVTNLITQGALNLLLNYISYKQGTVAADLYYVPLELAVFAAEAVIYSLMLPKRSTVPEKKQRPVLYAFLANLASFAAGIFLSWLIPTFF